MKTKVAKYLIKQTITVFIIYLLISLAACYFQRDLQYFPNKDLLAPDKYGLQAEQVSITTKDNVKLAAWYFPPNEKGDTIIYFHGNGGNLKNRARIYNVMKQAGFGVMAVSYRGYGTSEGSPTEEGLYEDARAAINFLVEKGIPSNKIIAFGESLGTGVAVQMATEYDLGAVALVSPYSSTVEIGQQMYPFLPVSLMMRDRYESINKIKNVTEPLIIFHGDKDNQIPIESGKKLFDTANNPKKFIIQEGRGHNNMKYDLEMMQTIKDF